VKKIHHGNNCKDQLSNSGFLERYHQNNMYRLPPYSADSPAIKIAARNVQVEIREGDKQ
jgi:hypothetical protein